MPVGRGGAWRGTVAQGGVGRTALVFLAVLEGQHFVLAGERDAGGARTQSGGPAGAAGPRGGAILMLMDLSVDQFLQAAVLWRGSPGTRGGRGAGATAGQP